MNEPEGTLYESTKKRLDLAAELVVCALLFQREALLEGPVQGTSSFQKDFELRGPFDSEGRSLSQFDLSRSLFLYPCSYLLSLRAFDALPHSVHSRVFARLDATLSHQNQKAEFAHLSADDRSNIRQILLATKPDFAASLQEGGSGHTRGPQPTPTRRGHGTRRKMDAGPALPRRPEPASLLR